MQAKKIVEAPFDGAAAGDKKEREAVKDRALASVHYRPKTLGKMILKISNGHLGEPVLRRKLRRGSGPVQATGAVKIKLVYC